jgi:hypothetical protein
MTIPERLNLVAGTDSTFRRLGPNWVGKCLICNGPLAFDARTGEGATLEHIRARTRGGTEDLENLGIVHGRCNWEKGRRWDPRKRRSQEEYDQFIARLVERRQQRWRPLPRRGGDGRPSEPEALAAATSASATAN